MGLTFLNTQDDQKVAQNKPGALFNLLVFYSYQSITVQTTVSLIVHIHHFSFEIFCVFLDFGRGLGKSLKNLDIFVA